MISRRGRRLLALLSLLVTAWSLSSVIGPPAELQSPEGPSSNSRLHGDLTAEPLTDRPESLAERPSETLDPDLQGAWDVESARDFPTPVRRGPAPAPTVESAPPVALPTGTTAPVPPGSVQLRPGDDVASIVSAAPTGANFWFTPGTYTGVSITPRANQVFLGTSGAVLAGNGEAFAFRSAAPGVTIQGFVIEEYQSPSRAAVIEGLDGATGWIVTSNEVRNNNEIGIRARQGWTLIGNYVHHNGRYGIAGSGSGVLIEDNEIAFNANLIGATGDSGGTKFVHTVDLVLRGNYAHNNFGNGLWVDINNVNALIENNRAIANTHQGIYLEISCGGIIRNNYLEGNGSDDPNPDYMVGAGILVAMTPNVQVYGNTLVNNAKGIGAIHWAHNNVGAVTQCDPELRNLRVHNNTITQTGGAAAGIDASIDRNLVYGDWDNKFFGNTYHLTDGARYRYQEAWTSAEEWTDAGLG